MLDDIRFLLGTFTHRDRVYLGLFVVGQFLASLMDLLGLAAVLPLMEVLLGADMTEGYLATMSAVLGNPTREGFVVTMAVLMVLAFALKAVASLALAWWSSGLIIRLQMGTASRLLRGFVAQSYLDYRRTNLPDIIRVVDAGASDAHGKVLGGILQLTSFVLSMGTVLIFLLIVSPAATLAALVYFGGVVFVIQRVLAARNRRAGKVAVEAAWRRSFALINSVLGFREIRMHDAAGFFQERFDQANADAGAAGRKAMMYNAAPRYVLEVAAITGIGVLLGVVASSQGSESIMPVVSLFIAAAIKLLPSLAGLTSTMGGIQNGRTGLRLVVETLSGQAAGAMPTRVAGDSQELGQELQPIDVRDVSFAYPDGDNPVVRDIGLHIPPGTSLAICGASGSGKTTLVDIILGLIQPDTGAVTYGGRAADELGAAWRRVVAYVPQDVFLMDDTLAANVAFGVRADERDEQKVRSALAHAELSELVDQLPDGLDSMLGERGSRISGGQRQRIGIARALYRDPKVIVLDEATSALDNETEDRVARTIRGLAGTVTTIIVAHRLSTVRHVDQLAFLRGGRVESVGSFEAVRRQSPDFARLVRLGNLDAPPADGAAG